MLDETPTKWDELATEIARMRLQEALIWVDEIRKKELEAKYLTREGEYSGRLDGEIDGD
jgi:hypothetical protein